MKEGINDMELKFAEYLHVMSEGVLRIEFSKELLTHEQFFDPYSLFNKLSNNKSILTVHDILSLNSFREEKIEMECFFEVLTRLSTQIKGELKYEE